MADHLLRLHSLARLAPFRNAYLRRGIGVWVILRLALASVAIPDPATVTEVVALGVVGVAVLLDAQRRREDLFLANLGIPSWAIAVLALPGALLAELLVP